MAKISYKRHLAKTITWRILGTLDTICISWIITGNPLTGLKIGFIEVFTSFFKKPGMGMALTFVLFFRLGESQLVKMAAPFLLDPIEKGGLGYSTEQLGTIFGTVGVIMLSIGGILGGILISRDGLKKWMLPMILSLNVPNDGRRTPTQETISHR